MRKLIAITSAIFHRSALGVTLMVGGIAVAQTSSSGEGGPATSTGPGIVVPPTGTGGGGGTGGGRATQATQAGQATQYSQPGNPYINQGPAIALPTPVPFGLPASPGVTTGPTEQPGIATGPSGPGEPAGPAIETGEGPAPSEGGRGDGEGAGDRAAGAQPAQQPRRPSSEQARRNRQSTAANAKALVEDGPSGPALSISKEAKPDLGPLLDGVAIAIQRAREDVPPPPKEAVADIRVLDLGDGDPADMEKKASALKDALDADAQQADEVNQEEQFDEAEAERQAMEEEERLRKKVPGRAEMADQEDALDDQQADVDEKQSALDEERERLEKQKQTAETKDQELRQKEQELRERDPNCRSADCRNVQRQRAENRQSLNRNAMEQGKLDQRQQKLSLEQRNIDRGRAEIEARRDRGEGLTRDEHYRRMAGKEYQRLQAQVDSTRSQYQQQVDELNKQREAYEEAGRDVPKRLDQAIKNAESRLEKAVSAADNQRAEFARSHTRRMEGQLGDARKDLSRLKAGLGKEPTREQRAELARAEAKVEQLTREVQVGHAISGSQGEAGQKAYAAVQQRHQEAVVNHADARREAADIQHQMDLLDPDSKEYDYDERFDELDAKLTAANKRVTEWSGKELDTQEEYRTARQQMSQADPEFALKGLAGDHEFNEALATNMEVRKTEVEMRARAARAEAERLKNDPSASTKDREYAENVVSDLENEAKTWDQNAQDLRSKNHQLVENAGKLREQAEGIRAFRDSGSLGLQNDPSGLPPEARMSNRQLVQNQKKIGKAIDQYEDAKSSVGEGGRQPEWSDRSAQDFLDARARHREAQAARDEAIQRNNNFSQQYKKLQGDLEQARAQAASNPSEENQKKVSQLEGQMSWTQREWGKAHRDYRMASHDLKEAGLDLSVNRHAANAERAQNFAGDYNRSFGDTLNRDGSVNAKALARSVDGFHQGAQTVLQREAQLQEMQGRRNALQFAASDARQAGADHNGKDLRAAQAATRSLDLRMDHAEDRQIRDINRLRDQGHHVNRGDDGRLVVSTRNPLVRDYIGQHVEGGKTAFVGEAGPAPVVQPFIDRGGSFPVAQAAAPPVERVAVAGSPSASSLPSGQPRRQEAAPSPPAQAATSTRAPRVVNVNDRPADSTPPPQGPPPSAREALERAIGPYAGQATQASNVQQAQSAAQPAPVAPRPTPPPEREVRRRSEVGKDLVRYEAMERAIRRTQEKEEDPEERRKNQERLDYIAERRRTLQEEYKRGTGGTQTRDTEVARPAEERVALPPKPGPVPPSVIRQNRIARNLTRYNRMRESIVRDQQRQTDPEERRKNEERIRYIDERKRDLVREFEQESTAQADKGPSENGTQTRSDSEFEGADAKPETEPGRLPPKPGPVPPSVRKGNLIVRELIRYNRMRESIVRAQQDETDPVERKKNEERLAYIDQRKKTLVQEYDQVTGRTETTDDGDQGTRARPTLVSDVMFGGEPPAPPPPPPPASPAEQNVQDYFSRQRAQDRQQMGLGEGEPPASTTSTATTSVGEDKDRDAVAASEKNEAKDNAQSDDPGKDEASEQETRERRERAAAGMERKASPPAPPPVSQPGSSADKNVSDYFARQRAEDRRRMGLENAPTPTPRPTQPTRVAQHEAQEQTQEHSEPEQEQQQQEDAKEREGEAAEDQEQTETARTAQRDEIGEGSVAEAPPAAPPVTPKVADAPPPNANPVASPTGPAVAGIDLRRWATLADLAAQAANATPGSEEWKDLQRQLQAMIPGMVQEISDRYNEATRDQQRSATMKEKLEMVTAISTLLSIPIYDVEGSTAGSLKRVYATDPAPWLNEIDQVMSGLQTRGDPETLFVQSKTTLALVTSLKELLGGMDGDDAKSDAMRRQLVGQVAKGYAAIAGASMHLAANTSDADQKAALEAQGMEAAGLSSRYQLVSGDAAGALKFLDGFRPTTEAARASQARSQASLIMQVEKFYGRMSDGQREALGSPQELANRKKQALSIWLNHAQTPNEVALAGSALAAEQLAAGDRQSAVRTLETARSKAPDHPGIAAARLKLEVQAPPPGFSSERFNSLVNTLPEAQRGSAIGAMLASLDGRTDPATIRMIQDAIEEREDLTREQKNALKTQGVISEMAARSSRAGSPDDLDALQDLGKQAKDLLEGMPAGIGRSFLQEQLETVNKRVAQTRQQRQAIQKTVADEDASVSSLTGAAREALASGQLDVAADALVAAVERSGQESGPEELRDTLHTAGNLMVQMRSLLQQPGIPETQRAAAQRFLDKVSSASVKVVDAEIASVTAVRRIERELKDEDGARFARSLDEVRSWTRMKIRLQHWGADRTSISQAIAAELNRLDERVDGLENAIRTYFADYDRSDLKGRTGKRLKMELAQLNVRRAQRDALRDLQLDLATSQSGGRTMRITATDPREMTAREYELQRLFIDLNGFHPGRGDQAWIEQRRRDGKINGTREQLRMGSKTTEANDELSNLDRVMLADMESYQQRRMAQLVNENGSLDTAAWRQSWEGLIQAEKTRRDAWGNPAFKLFPSTYAYSEERAEALQQELDQRSANNAATDLAKEKRDFETAVRDGNAQKAALVLVRAREQSLARQIDLYANTMNVYGHQGEVGWGEEMLVRFTTGQIHGQKIRFVSDTVRGTLEMQSRDQGKLHQALIRMAHNPIELLSQDDQDLLESRGFIANDQYTIPEGIKLRPYDTAEKFSDHGPVDEFTSGWGATKIVLTVAVPGAASAHLARGAMTLRGLRTLHGTSKVLHHGAMLGIEAALFTGLNRGARLAVDPRGLETPEAWTAQAMGKEFMHNMLAMGALKVFGKAAGTGRDALKSGLGETLAGTTVKARMAQSAFTLGTGAATFAGEVGLLSGLAAMDSEDAFSQDTLAANLLMVTILKARPGKSEFLTGEVTTARKGVAEGSERSGTREKAETREAEALRERMEDIAQREKQLKADKKRLKEMEKTAETPQEKEWVQMEKDRIRVTNETIGEAKVEIARERVEAQTRVELETMQRLTETQNVGEAGHFSPKVRDAIKSYMDMFGGSITRAERAWREGRIDRAQYESYERIQNWAAERANRKVHHKTERWTTEDAAVAARFMKKFKGDWVKAQKAYAKGEVTEAELREYTQLRKRVVDQIANEIVRDLNGAMERGLLEKGSEGHKVQAFGSENVTSDYDLSFVGPHAELAVILFNARWASMWGRASTVGGGESAVRFDTNTYTDPVFKTFEGGESDIRFQDTFANLAGRKYMGDAKWKAYRSWVEANASPRIRAEVRKMMNDVETMHRNFEGDAAKEIQQQVDAAKLSGRSISREQADIAARNRLYERSLQKIIELKGEYRKAETVEARERVAQQLRNAQSKALYFAAEAYFTRGAIDHVVMSIQASGRTISAETLLAGRPNTGDVLITPEMARQSYTEQISNMYKEMGHSHGEAKYAGKFAKYFIRAMDAATLANVELGPMERLVRETVEIEAVRSNPTELKEALHRFYGERNANGELTKSAGQVTDAEVAGYVQRYQQNLQLAENALTASINASEALVPPSQRVAGTPGSPRPPDGPSSGGRSGEAASEATIAVEVGSPEVGSLPPAARSSREIANEATIGVEVGTPEVGSLPPGARGTREIANEATIGVEVGSPEVGSLPPGTRGTREIANEATIGVEVTSDLPVQSPAGPGGSGKMIEVAYRQYTPQEVAQKLAEWKAETRKPMDVGELPWQFAETTRDASGKDLKLYEQAREAGVDPMRLRGIEYLTAGDRRLEYVEVAKEAARAEGLEPVTPGEAIQWRTLATRIERGTVSKQEADALWNLWQRADARGENFADALGRKGFVSTEGFNFLLTPTQVGKVMDTARFGKGRSLDLSEQAALIAQRFQQGQLREFSLVKAARSAVNPETGVVDPVRLQNGIRQALAKGDLTPEILGEYSTRTLQGMFEGNVPNLRPQAPRRPQPRQASGDETRDVQVGDETVGVSVGDETIGVVVE